MINPTFLLQLLIWTVGELVKTGIRHLHCVLAFHNGRGIPGIATGVHDALKSSKTSLHLIQIFGTVIPEFCKSVCTERATRIPSLILI